MLGRLDISKKNGANIAPMNVKNIRLKAGNQKITLNWEDPENTYDDDGTLLCTWLGTKVVYKIGSYPNSPTDGTIVVDNQEKNKYSETGFEINNLTNGETYYFAFYPYSDKKVYNKNEANRISGVPVAYRTMTVKIDQNNSNPESCCTYADDAINMIPGSSDWDDFFGHYPVMLKNGVEGKKLDRNDFSKYEDGSPADITSGNEGDVMIAFPRRGLKIFTDENNVITVSMTDDPNKDGFEYNAHRRNDVQKDMFYIGAYKGYIDNNKLRSLSGKKPLDNQTISQCRTLAQANGKSDGTSSGYEQSGWFQLIYRQAMYVLKFKNLDSQKAVGYGYTNSDNSDTTNTGGTNTYGMDCEVIKQSKPTYMTNGKYQVKCLGIEDFWGNNDEWIDGVATDTSCNIMTATTNFNDKKTNYKKSGTANVIADRTYIKNVFGTTETGFIAKTGNGSETTYFSDFITISKSFFGTFGGNWNCYRFAGAFKLNFEYSETRANAYITARLMYL